MNQRNFRADRNAEGATWRNPVTQPTAAGGRLMQRAKKIRAEGRKKSKASSPAPFLAHMGRDLNGQPGIWNRRNGQHDTANRSPERNKQRQTKKQGNRE